MKKRLWLSVVKNLRIFVDFKMQNKFLKNIIQNKNGEEPNETKEDDKDDNIEGAQKLGKMQKQSLIKK